MTMLNHPISCARASARLMLWMTGVPLALLGCGSVDPNARAKVSALECTEWTCEADAAAGRPDYLQRIGCLADFQAVADVPSDTSIPGALSVKVVLDQQGGIASEAPDAGDGGEAPDALYFQDSDKYGIHWDFASVFLPNVPSLSSFNQTEYFLPSRRFILGAVTYYEGPKVWALEIAPYDRASPAMIEKLYRAVKEAAYFGCSLAFHPTSKPVEDTAPFLSKEVPVKFTDEIFAGIPYQPLMLATGAGRLRFVDAAQLSSTYLTTHDIVVLDRVPNDITVVMGLITEEFQTPLSHVNVLSQNRGTPNMGLRKATTNPTLRALEGKWVELKVGAEEWEITEVSADEANAFWEAKKPAQVQVAQFNTAETELKSIEDIVPASALGTRLLKDEIRAAIPAFGGKASHFSVLARISALTVPPAFGVPIYYYDQFMRENGFSDRLAQMLADPTFKSDPKVRDEQLAQLRYDMQKAPVNQEFQDRLWYKLQERLPQARAVRFRSSTNGEDLEGFTGAGLYESNTGITDNWESVLDGVRATWAATWRFRAYEERDYRSIDQTMIGMALLVHPTFTNELGSGVCLTASPFDTSGLVPAFYVNAQYGDASVVLPDPGVTTDEFLYYYEYVGQPTTYLNQSNLLPEGQDTVLTNKQVHELGVGLDAIHRAFSWAYGSNSVGYVNGDYYAMDVEFKLNVQPGTTEPHIVFKQARPHPGRGSDPLAAEDE
jgi:hypothetical protein